MNETWIISDLSDINKYAGDLLQTMERDIPSYPPSDMAGKAYEAVRVGSEYVNALRTLWISVQRYREREDITEGRR